MGLLENLGEKLAAAAASFIRAPDASSFGDPLATQVPWTRLKKSKAGVSNFRTLKLVADGEGRLRYQRSTQMTLAALAFGVPGLVFAAVCAVKLSPCAVFGLVFLGIGVYLLLPVERTFDRNAKQIVIARERVPFEAVHALQLLEHWESGEESGGYYSYQLNLVMKDRSRIAVVDHSKLEVIRQEAQQLAAHLGVKLWDGPAAPQLNGQAALQALTAEEKPR